MHDIIVFGAGVIAGIVGFIIVTGYAVSRDKGHYSEEHKKHYK